MLLALNLIVVEPDQVLNRIAPSMYGACIEDVNHEIYGGLYAQRIFGESFEEPAPGTQPHGWRALGGEWSPDGEGVHVRGGNGPKLVRDAADLGDGTLEAEVVVPNDLGENAGLLVRVSRAGVGADDFDGYEVAISPKRRQIILGKHVHDFRQLLTVDAPIHPGRWHRLRVAMDGARLRVFLDQEAEPRIDFTDPAAPLTTGTFALRSWQSAASFKNVRFEGRSVPLDLSGPGVSRMWDRVLSGTAKATFAVEGGAFNGALCQRIDHLGGKGRAGVANRGLNRWGIPAAKGRTMEGRIYLRGDVGRATVALQSVDGRRTYASQSVGVGPSWRKAGFRLRSNTTDPNARFAVWIDRPGTLWADQAVLIDPPENRFRGLPVRRDIADEMLANGLTFLRYGGTMVNVPGYRWKNMIGDPDRRPPYAGHWYPSSTNGFGIFDFLRFCETAKVGAAFAINVDESPEDAADLAEYLTGPIRSEWGRRRAENGHPAPYRLEYLQIGNEEAIGNPDAFAMARYARRFRILAEAIHRKNPKLRLVASAWWLPDSPAMKTVFDAIDGVAAAWDFHFWTDAPNSGTLIDEELQRARRLFKTWNPDSTLQAVVFEQNGGLHNLQRALGHATATHATRRHGDFVLVDCSANALQPWRQNDNGWDQGRVFFTPDRAWSMPPAFAQGILARDHLPLRVKATTDSGLDVLATKSEDGRTIVLSAVNVSDRPVPAVIAIQGAPARSARAVRLSGELGATNPPSAPKQVAPQEAAARIGEDGVEVTFAPRSVTSLRIAR